MKSFKKECGRKEKLNMLMLLMSLFLLHFQQKSQIFILYWVLQIMELALGSPLRSWVILQRGLARLEESRAEVLYQGSLKQRGLWDPGETREVGQEQGDLLWGTSWRPMGHPLGPRSGALSFVWQEEKVLIDSWCWGRTTQEMLPC